jgi:putative transcriptional regulator
MREDRSVSAESLRSRLIVAAPPLVDPNFDRTVVLMLEHGADGALGLVLNRPSDTDLADAVPEWGGLACEPPAVFLGGPVSPESVIALAQSPERDEGDGWVPITPGIGTVDLGRAPGDLPVTIDRVRVFVGYAGWAPGQLESELEQQAWFVVDFDLGDAFDPNPEGLWRRVLRRQRSRIAIFANSPGDPSVN